MSPRVLIWVQHLLGTGHVVRAAAIGVSAAGPLYFLAALLVLALTLAPFATGAALAVGAD